MSDMEEDPIQLLFEIQKALRILHYPAMHDLLQRINALFGDPIEKRR